MFCSGVLPDGEKKRDVWQLFRKDSHGIKDVTLRFQFWHIRLKPQVLVHQDDLYAVFYPLLF